MPTKRERLEEFYRRLKLAPPARTRDEAFDMVRRILTEVEDELSGFPADPKPPLKSTDRMYPPKGDLIYEVPGKPAVTRLRSRLHNTFIGDNGSIEIQKLGGAIEFTKPGADGKSVGDL